MWGVITHVSYPKRSTAYTTALNNIPDTCGFPPYRPKILDNQSQLLIAFLRLPTTAIQLSFEAIRIRPRYFNYNTDFSG